MGDRVVKRDCRCETSTVCGERAGEEPPEERTGEEMGRGGTGIRESDTAGQARYVVIIARAAGTNNIVWL